MHFSSILIFETIKKTWIFFTLSMTILILITVSLHYTIKYYYDKIVIFPANKPVFRTSCVVLWRIYYIYIYICNIKSNLIIYEIHTQIHSYFLLFFGDFSSEGSSHYVAQESPKQTAFLPQFPYCSNYKCLQPNIVGMCLYKEK